MVRAFLLFDEFLSSLVLFFFLFLLCYPSSFTPYVSFFSIVVILGSMCPFVVPVSFC